MVHQHRLSRFGVCRKMEFCECANKLGGSCRKLNFTRSHKDLFRAKTQIMLSLRVTIIIVCYALDTFLETIHSKIH